MAKVGLVFGGRSVEHLVSVQSARTIAHGLQQTGHQVVPLGIAEDGCFVSCDKASAALAGERASLPAEGLPIRTTLGPLLEAEVDVVFPTVHGTHGEDGTLQGLLEMLDLPYVGAGVAASAIAMDKLACKRALEAVGMDVVEYAEVRAAAFAADRAAALREARELPFPLFVKPSVGGSSVGILRVAEPADLEAAVSSALRFHPVVLIERGVQGRELECAVLGFRSLEASVIGEIVPGRDFYDYEDKYLSDGAKLIAPADLEATLSARLQEAATRAMLAIGGEGMARVDFFLEGERLFVNEINTLPGFTSISMYPRLWALSGRPLGPLVDELVSLALERHAARRSFDAEIRGFVAQIHGRQS
jgi:D-alanine-D-alanine ligase